MSYEDDIWTPVVERMDCPAGTAAKDDAVTKWRMRMPDGLCWEWWSKDVSGSASAMSEALLVLRERCRDISELQE